jgi:DNA polymerase-3 subunit alpha
VWKYAKELDLRFPNLETPEKIEPGAYNIIGVIKTLRNHKDKKGNEMAFGTIEDNRGEIDLVFFARAWESCKALASVNEIFALKGSIEPPRDKTQAKPSFVVSSIQDVNKLIRAAERKAADSPNAALPQSDKVYRQIHIRLATHAAYSESALHSLKDCIEGNPGTCPVYIHTPASSTERETVILASGQIDPASSAALANCAAVAEVWGV